ncbi:MAG: hypothetical protein AB7K37_09445 [Cyclobacteriaceae bacterium]
MTRDEVQLFIENGLPPNSGTGELVETHISWVVLCKDFAYKIKKPIHYSFLDFSSLEKRKHFLQEELRLNWRLTFNVYLGIDCIREAGAGPIIGGRGKVIDYALRMRKLDRSKQMDQLVGNNDVLHADLAGLADRLIRFHRRTRVVHDANPLEVVERFDDLRQEIPYFGLSLGNEWASEAEESLQLAAGFIRSQEPYLNKRLKAGWYRDAHGDLHTRNIFLLPEPVVFDCVEFNAAYREIDLLNELAFLCMDLESFNRADLADDFFRIYTQAYPLEISDDDRALFLYYKSYRANVRAKVNSLRAQSAATGTDRDRALKEVVKYLTLMRQYLGELAFA